MGKPRLSPDDYAQGVLAGDRLVLSRAITLVESQLPADQALAQAVLTAVVPRAGRSVRVGITGVPGVGKSTFIEALGTHLTGLGHRVAVLTVDPSSARTRGSILGDKTRMDMLSNDPRAYVRPSPAGGALGGVARKTRETMLLCEAAGFDTVLVETVGVGQSETTVRHMVDFFLLLALAGAGDELQGIKKGIVEMADAIAINKADGDNQARARLAQADYQLALHLFPPAESGWSPPVVTCSARTRAGIADLWQLVEAYGHTTRANGFFDRQRQQQQLAWLHDTIRQSLEAAFYQQPAVQVALADVEAAVRAGKLPPTTAAQWLMNAAAATQPGAPPVA